MSDEPKEQTPHWHLKRAYALLFRAGLSDPVLMEACALIDDAHRLINGKDEPQPIRRGDVVQVIEPRVSPSLFGTIFTVTETDGSYIRDVPTLLPTRMPMSWVVRIGRARYYPDGTPVED